MDRKALRNISYGLYIVCSKEGENFNGQIANTVIQITSDPPTIAVSINKENLTHSYIKNSNTFTVSILNQDVPMETIGKFGFKSGRDINKFQGIDYEIGTTGVPLINENVVSQLEAKVINSIDIKTHTIFVGKIVDAKIVGKGEPITYAYYHQVKKGKAPKTAPTYQPDEEKDTSGDKEKPGEVKDAKKYRCKVCGYIYDPDKGDVENEISPGTSLEELPQNWVCPVCGAGKDEFESI